MKRLLPAILFLSVGPAFSATTGDDLLRACSAPAESAERHDCIAYINGAVDASVATTTSFAFLRDHEDGDARLFCVGPEEPQEKVVAAVTRYLEDHPENRASNAASNVLLALIGAYPCSRRPGAPGSMPARKGADNDVVKKP